MFQFLDSHLNIKYTTIRLVLTSWILVKSGIQIPLYFWQFKIKYSKLFLQVVLPRFTQLELTSNSWKMSIGNKEGYNYNEVYFLGWQHAYPSMMQIWLGRGLSCLNDMNTWYQPLVTSLQLGYVLVDRPPPYIKPETRVSIYLNVFCQKWIAQCDHLWS